VDPTGGPPRGLSLSLPPLISVYVDPGMFRPWPLPKTARRHGPGINLGPS